jgi:hypothetical protein
MGEYLALQRLISMLPDLEASLEATYSELSIYEAAIAAGTLLPVPSTNEERRRLFSLAVPLNPRSMTEYVEGLRQSVSLKEEMLTCMRLDKARREIYIIQLNVRQARQELDAADFANAVATSMTLPRAMGKGAVSRGVETRSDIRETSQ